MREGFAKCVDWSMAFMKSGKLERKFEKIFYAFLRRIEDLKVFSIQFYKNARVKVVSKGISWKNA